MQMMSPIDALQVVKKLRQLGAQDVFLCERGTVFGYQNLVVDLLGVSEMVQSGTPVVVDVSHALQMPGAGVDRSGGRGQLIRPLARAAVALGIAGLFFECHPDPSSALCDGPCALPLDEVHSFLTEVSALDALIKGYVG